MRIGSTMHVLGHVGQSEGRIVRSEIGITLEKYTKLCVKKNEFIIPTNIEYNISSIISLKVTDTLKRFNCTITSIMSFVSHVMIRTNTNYRRHLWSQSFYYFWFFRIQNIPTGNFHSQTFILSVSFFTTVSPSEREIDWPSLILIKYFKSKMEVFSRSGTVW